MKQKLEYSTPATSSIDIIVKLTLLTGYNEGGGGNENYGN